MCNFNNPLFRNDALNNKINELDNRIFNHRYINNERWNVKVHFQLAKGMSFVFAIHRGFIFPEYAREQHIPGINSNIIRFGCRIRIRQNGHSRDIRNDLTQYMLNEFPEWPNYEFDEPARKFEQRDFANYIYDGVRLEEFNDFVIDLNNDVDRIIDFFMNTIDNR